MKSIVNTVSDRLAVKLSMQSHSDPTVMRNQRAAEAQEDSWPSLMIVRHSGNELIKWPMFYAEALDSGVEGKTLKSYQTGSASLERLTVELDRALSASLPGRYGVMVAMRGWEQDIYGRHSYCEGGVAI